MVEVTGEFGDEGGLRWCALLGVELRRLVLMCAVAALRAGAELLHRDWSWDLVWCCGRIRFRSWTAVGALIE